MTLFWSLSFEQIFIGILISGLVINSVITYVYKRQLANANSERTKTEKALASKQNEFDAAKNEISQLENKVHTAKQDLETKQSELDDARNETTKFGEKLKGLVTKEEEDELRHLIGPLHAAFAKDDEIIEFMSLIDAHILLQYFQRPKEREELAKLRAEIKKIMYEFLDLARDPLDKEIDTYLKLPLFPENKQKAKEVLKNIKILVEKRQHELGAKRNGYNKEI